MLRFVAVPLVYLNLEKCISMENSQTPQAHEPRGFKYKIKKKLNLNRFAFDMLFEFNHKKEEKKSRV
jgi:hypothetical protein